MSFKSELAAILPYKISYFDWSLVKGVPQYLAALDRLDYGLIQKRIMELVRADLDVITDPQSQGHLLACATIHTLFDILLEKGMSDACAIELLTEAFQKPGKLLTKLIMRLVLFFSRNKRNMVERETRAKSLTQYGEQFEFAEEVGDDCFVSIIKKCAYFDYFGRHDLTQLTPIFCAWDAVWIEEIERQKNGGVAFERPTTLGWGGQSCRFEFHFDEKLADQGW